VHFLLMVFYVLLFSIIILRSRFFSISGTSKYWFVAVFWAKVAMGTAMYFIYSNHYTDRATADIFKYFDDSYYMTEALWNKPTDYFKMLFGVWNNSDYFNEMYYDKMNNWFRVYKSSMYNDSHAIIRFNAFVRIFSFGFFHVHTVFMSFLSLIGLTAFFKSIQMVTKQKTKLFFGVIFLTPSVLFWSSGVLKEGIMFFALGIMLYGLVAIKEKRTRCPLGWTLLILFLIPLLFQVKFYVFACFSLGAFGYALYHSRLMPRLWLNYLIATVVVFFVGMNFHHFSPEFNLLDLIVIKQQDLIALAQEEKAGSLFELTRLQPSLFSLVQNAPEAILNSFLRPFPWDASGALMWVGTLENGLVLGYLFLVLFFFKRPAKPQLNMALSLILSGFLILVVVGWTTPVSGALIRYKVPGVLALLCGATFFLHAEKLKQFFSR